MKITKAMLEAMEEMIAVPCTLSERGNAVANAREVLERLEWEERP